MTEHELELRLRNWYHAQVDVEQVAPPVLRASVLDIPDRMPFDRGAAARSRFLLLVAAAMLLVLLVGGAIAIGSGLLRLPRPQTELPPVEGPPAWVDQMRTDLPAGTYYLDLPLGRTDAGAIRVTFTLPNGWEHVNIDGLLWGQSKWLILAVPDNVYTEGCTAHVQADPPAGPAAADLAAALQRAAGWSVLGTTDVTLDGYSGKRVELVAPADSSRCIDDLRLLHAQGGPGFVPSMRDAGRMTLWILDVNGDSLAISAGSELDATGAALAERQAVIDSMQIELLRGLPLQHQRGSAPD